MAGRLACSFAGRRIDQHPHIGSAGRAGNGAVFDLRLLEPCGHRRHLAVHKPGAYLVEAVFEIHVGEQFDRRRKLWRDEVDGRLLALRSHVVSLPGFVFPRFMSANLQGGKRLLAFLRCQYVPLLRRARCRSGARRAGNPPEGASRWPRPRYHAAQITCLNTTRGQTDVSYRPRSPPGSSSATVRRTVHRQQPRRSGHAPARGARADESEPLEPRSSR